MVDVLSPGSLSESLGLKERELVSIVGAGGKTTLMYKLVSELHRGGASVAAATTTRIFAPGRGDPVTLVCGRRSDELLRGITASSKKPPVLGRGLLDGNKVAGLDKDLCDALYAGGALDFLVVEADGARRKPVKAPGETEPVVPAATTVFVAVLGLSCLQEKLSEETAFRPELVARAAGIDLLDTITIEGLVNLLSSENGLRKGCPPQGRGVVVLNQADSRAQVEAAREMADQLLTRNAGWERVVIARLEKERPIEEVWMP